MRKIIDWVWRGAFSQQKLVFGIGVVLLVSNGCGPPKNYVLPDVGGCTAEDLQDWFQDINYFYGVVGTDPNFVGLGPWPAERGFWNTDTWFPLPHTGGYNKRILCGTLWHYSYNADDDDWNLYIIPDDLFSSIISDPLEMGISDPGPCDPAISPGSQDGIHDCQTCDDCLAAELNPDQMLEDNWLFTSSGTSPFVGIKICTYGPWVRDNEHLSRPEIHPSELIWWREYLSGGTVLYYLMVLQDDSPYFDDNDNFDFDGDELFEGWEPWAQAPRTGQFKVAFEINPEAPPGAFYITELFNRFVVTSNDADARRDSDDGNVHAIEYNDKIILRVYELQDNDADLGVRFGNICRRFDGTLLGHLVITSKVSEDDSGKEGFHILNLVYTPNDPLDPDTNMPDEIAIDKEFANERPQLPKILLRAKSVEQSLRRVKSPNKAQLVADIQLKIKGGPGSTPDDLIISNVKQLVDNQRQLLNFKQDQPGEYTLIEVPVIEKAQLEFTIKSDTLLTIDSPAFALAPFILDEKPLSSTIDTLAWPVLTNHFADDSTDTKLAAQLMKAGNWELKLAPSYAPITNGEIRPEENSPLTTDLNQALSKDDSTRIEQLFGSSQPFDVQWSFAAINLASGEPVPIKVGEDSASTQIRIEFMPSMIPRANIKATFPETAAGAIYQLTATATVTDVYGNSGKIQHRVWSHHLLVDKQINYIDPMLASLATLTGVSPYYLIAASKRKMSANERHEFQSPEIRRAQMMRFFLVQAARDIRISIDELRILVRGAKLFGKL